MTKQRINRRTFVSAYALSFLIGFILAGIAEVTSQLEGALRSIIGTFDGLLLLAYVIYLVLTWIILMLRRLHDIGWPWWLIVFFGIFEPFLIVLVLMPGKNSANRYGDVPAKAVDLRSALIWW